VFVVELDGQHVTASLLRTDAQSKGDLIALDQFTHGRLGYAHALRRQRTCRRQPITTQRPSAHA